MKYDFETVLNRSNTGSTKWEEMKKYGLGDCGIVPLSNAEMEFRNAPEITEGLREYISNTVLSYFDPQETYFDAVINWFARRYDFRFERKCVIPNPSLHCALCTALYAYSQPGDSIVVMQPTWPGFLGAVKRSGRTIVTNRLLENDDVYSIDFELLEEQLSDPSAKMMLLCSPHNPVGRVWTREELERIGSLCVKHGIVIVSDEIHADLTMPGFRHYPIATISPEIAARTVTFTGASKAFNLAGLDTSNVIITDDDMRTKYMNMRRNEGISNPNMLGLKACELAYTKGEKWLEECIGVIAQNADTVSEYLRDRLPSIKCTRLEGTYLMWLDFRSLGMDYTELEEALMRKAHLFMDDGYYFGEGGKGFVRMNISCPRSVIIQSLDRLEKWVSSLN